MGEEIEMKTNPPAAEPSARDVDDEDEGEIQTKGVQFTSGAHPQRVETTHVSSATKISVTFEGLCYGVKVGKGKNKTTKWLLTEVTGSIQPGQLTALMGPSGAGKSTLLDVVAGRKNEGIIEGDLLFNGRERNKDMKRFFGYVEQKDILLPTLTVRETLTYTAKLRMSLGKGVKVSSEVHDKRVQEVIDMLGLTVCADVLVGDETLQGISGGQAKRVSAGMELITNPSILFLDEPTSGLDSQTSLEFIKVIKTLCDTGVTVICTIHQPSSDVFAHFDRLLLLVTGEVVYLGPCEKAPLYFIDKGFPMPIDMNPADFLVSVTSGTKPQIDLPEIEAWPNVDVRYFIEEYKKDALSEMRKISTKRVRASGEQIVLKKDMPMYANSAFYNIGILLSRHAKKSSRDPNFLYKRVIQTVLTSLIFMTVYLNSPCDTQGIRSKQALFILSVIFFTMGAGAFVGPIFAERHFIKRELHAGTYPVHAAYLSSFFFEFPFNLVKSILWSIILYWSVGFKNEFVNWVFFWLMSLILVDLGIAIATLFAYMMPSKDAAAALCATIPLVMVMFSGFFITKENIPDYWIWCYYISYTNYAMSGFVINEFGGGSPYATCGDGFYTSSSGTPLTSEYIIGTIAGAATNGFLSNAWANLGCTFICWLIVRVCAYLALLIIKH